MNIMDIFNNDAFSLESLVAQVNSVDYVPGRAGDLAFGGVGEGVNTTSIAFEVKAEALTLIPSNRRGDNPTNETRDKGAMKSITVPQFALQETIGSEAIQNVRAFGSNNVLQGAEAVVTQQLGKMGRRHDLTLENLRLGALRGNVIDGTNGTVLADLFDLFDVTPFAPVVFDLEDVTNHVSDSDGTGVSDGTAELKAVRVICQRIKRAMIRSAKTNIPAGAQIWAFCGDNFFDKLVESTSVKGVWDGWAAAERRLGANYAFSVYEFAGVMFENYQGTDDNSKTVGVNTNEAQFFWTGVPGMYAEYYAPADFWETVNTLGLPRYAKIAPDPKFNRFVEVHTQMNPLPVCLRPKTLVTGVVNGGESESPDGDDLE